MKCPKPEMLFEWVSVPREMPFLKRQRVKFHCSRCSACKNKSQKISQAWSHYLAPEPDITPSLMRVYSRLQKDETLILKGWKIGQTPARQSLSGVLIHQGWLFRGAVGLGLGVIGFLLFSGQNFKREAVASNDRKIPLAQIRVENKNSVTVHYVQPELLHTVEFETASGR